MALLEFKEKYRSGIDSIDFEHEQLIDRINDLHRALSQDRGDGQLKGDVETVLGDLHAGIAAHFALEEKMMRDMNYEDYESHSAEHHQLLDEIHEISNRFSKDQGYDYLPALEAEIKRWFFEHFANADAKLNRMLGAHHH